MSDPETDPSNSRNIENLGYKQEMSRNRGLAHILFMTLAIIAVPYGLAAPLQTTIIGGGPATMIWGWVLVSIMTQPLACSLAEIASKYPTSAGAYYWCFRLASPRSRLLLSWINGWLTMVGVWTISLSVTFGVSQFIVAGAELFHPEWQATPWQTYCIFLAMNVFTSIVCLFFNDALPTLDVLSGVWMILGVIAILVSLSVKAAVGRHSASYALGHFDASAAGWTPGWAFFIGLLAPAYTYSAIGMIASMAEEVRNPAREVPLAIIWSIPSSAVIGLMFLLPIAFTLPDAATLLSVTSGQPSALMFELVMGSRAGGFGLWFIVFGVGMFCAVSICCAASRATWAFARDKALPFHTTFAHINKRFSGIPFNAFLLSTAIQVLLGLLYLGSSAAFNAFVGVAATCLGASYIMPLIISLSHGRRDMLDAPFNLGRWGTPLNVIAVLWDLLLIVIYSMPAVIPVTKTSMSVFFSFNIGWRWVNQENRYSFADYASAVFVGFGLISAAWYMISGRHHYSGPPMPISENSSPSSPADTKEIDIPGVDLPHKTKEVS